MRLDLKETILMILLAAVGFGLYANALGAPFIFDDSHMIVENAFIKDYRHLPWLFKGYVTSAPIPRGMLRPFLMLTFAFNYFSGRLEPAGYHIINILFHFLNAALLYLLLKTLLPQARKGLTFMITALFLVHPLNSEAVNYISSRSDLMTAGLVMTAFLLYLKRRPWNAVLAYAAALLTKETGLVLIFIVPAYELLAGGAANRNSPSPVGFGELPVKTGKPAAEKYKKTFLAGMIIVTAFYLLYKSTLFSPAATALLRSHFSNVLVQSAVTMLYLKLFIVPSSLNILHHIPGLNSLWQWQALWSVAGMAALAGSVFYVGRKNPVAGFGLAWFFIGLLPKFYARLSFVACEHHFYIPGMGLYIFLAALLCGQYVRHKKYFLYVGSGILILAAILTWYRNYEFSDGLRLWSAAGQRNPYSGTIQINLGLEYLKAGRTDEAEIAFKKAEALNDRVETVVYSRVNLATIYISRGQYDAATQKLQEALKSRDLPAPGIYQNLGIVYARTGKETQALQAWQKELSLYPASHETYLNLAIYYLGKEDLAEAEKAFQSAATIAPDHYAAYYGLGRIREEQGRLREAVNFYYTAVTLKSDDAASIYYLGSALAKLGRPQARQYLLKTIWLNPGFGAAHNDLAVFYASRVPPDWNKAKKNALRAKALGYPVDEKLLQTIEGH